MGQQPPPPFGQDPRQYQGAPQYPPQPPYGQQQPYSQAPPPGAPQGPQPARRSSRPPWTQRHKVLTGILGVTALFAAGGIGAAAAGGSKAAAGAEPGPTVTVTRTAPAVTVTKTVTKRVIPTSNAQGEATRISADGVYVIGQDIPGGTWHTSGGSQCYEATLASTDTSNIIDNNNFTGPDTVSLAGAKAFDISGGCTWQQEG